MIHESTNIDIVVQEEVSGCGIACVAMLAGVPYNEVKERANAQGIFAEDTKLWSETNYVRTLLNDYCIAAEPSERPFTSWDALPDLALIAIKYHLEEGKPFWHWSIFNRNNQQAAVLDPAAYLKDNRRTDFENMDPEWFIEIYQKQ